MDYTSRRKEFDKLIKAKIKDNRRIKAIFYAIARASLKADIFESLIRKGYEYFGIEYVVKKILYQDEKSEGYLQKMYIGYFDMTSIGDHSYEYKKQQLMDFYYQIIYGVLEVKCREKNINIKGLLNTEFVGRTFDWRIKNFSAVIVNTIFKKMFVFYSKVVKYFDESFEKRGNNYILRADSDFLKNDEKNKLFKEFKFSMAENYYISTLNKSIKEDFKEFILAKYKEHFDKNIEILQNKLLDSGESTQLNLNTNIGNIDFSKPIEKKEELDGFENTGDFGSGESNGQQDMNQNNQQNMQKSMYQNMN